MITEVNFRLAGGAQPLVLVPASVNGAAARDFILDTGASTSLLSVELARELGVEGTSTKEGHVAGGKLSVAVGRVASLSVGGAGVEDLEVAVMDLGDIGRAVGARIDGDVGYNFLKNFRVTVDYKRGLLRLASGRYETLGSAALSEVGFRLAGPAKPLALVRAVVNGTREEEFALDTGCSTTMISPALADAMGLRAAPGEAATTGGGHTLATSFASLDSLSVAGATARGLTVVVADTFRRLSQVTGARFEGIVGYNFLKDYALTIDYPNSALSLSPNNRAASGSERVGQPQSNRDTEARRS